MTTNRRTARRTASSVLASIIRHALIECEAIGITWAQWLDRAPGVYDKAGGEGSKLVLLESLIDEHSKGAWDKTDTTMVVAWEDALAYWPMDKRHQVLG